MPQGKGTYGSKRGRPPIKAHQGMAHVPKPSGQQAPSKAKGTAATAPRPKRMIGLPQQFKGGNRRRVPMPEMGKRPTLQVEQPKQSDAGGGRGVGPVFELPNMGRGKPIQSPKAVSKPQEVSSVRVPRTPMVGKPVPKPVPKPKVNPNTGLYEQPLKNISQQRDAFKNKQAARLKQFNKARGMALDNFNTSQRDAMNTFRTVNKGGYMSRAKYGIVDNLKKST